MATIRRHLYREAVRHAISSTIAALFVAIIIFVGRSLGFVELGAALTSLLVTLLFGLYGPIFLVLSWWTFRGVEGESLRSLLSRSNERSRLMRWLFLSSPTSWAATVLVIGVISVILLTMGDARTNLWIVSICVLGVIGAWVLMGAVMAVEYMRSWANDDSMVFPGQEKRTFSDFLYLALQLSTTFSSGDVELIRRPARRLAALHSVIAFAYSTAIIAVFASLLISTTG